MMSLPFGGDSTPGFRRHPGDTSSDDRAVKELASNRSRGRREARPLVACQAPALRHVIGSCEALIHHAPERSDGLGLVIEEILEEAGFAEGGWIGVSFPVVATFFNPVVRFTRIDTGE